MNFKINRETAAAFVAAKYMIFETDDEFADFSVMPYTEIKQSKDGILYISNGDYTEDYKRCLREGKIFVIKEKNSTVCKRELVSKRVAVKQNGELLERDTLVQLPVQNVIDWQDYQWELRVLENRDNH